MRTKTVKNTLGLLYGLILTLPSIGYAQCPAWGPQELQGLIEYAGYALYHPDNNTNFLPPVYINNFQGKIGKNKDPMTIEFIYDDWSCNSDIPDFDCRHTFSVDGVQLHLEYRKYFDNTAKAASRYQFILTKKIWYGPADGLNATVFEINKSYRPDQITETQAEDCENDIRNLNLPTQYSH